MNPTDFLKQRVGLFKDFSAERLAGGAHAVSFAANETIAAGSSETRWLRAGAGAISAWFLAASDRDWVLFQLDFYSHQATLGSLF